MQTPSLTTLLYFSLNFFQYLHTINVLFTATKVYFCAERSMRFPRHPSLYVIITNVSKFNVTWHALVVGFQVLEGARARVREQTRARLYAAVLLLRASVSKSQTAKSSGSGSAVIPSTYLGEGRQGKGSIKSCWASERNEAKYANLTTSFRARKTPFLYIHKKEINYSFVFSHNSNGCDSFHRR